MDFARDTPPEIGHQGSVLRGAGGVRRPKNHLLSDSCLGPPVEKIE